jgi:hypothetical protein
MVEYGTEPLYSEGWKYYDERGRPIPLPKSGIAYTKEGVKLRRYNPSPPRQKIHDQDSDSPPNEVATLYQKFGKMGWKTRKGNAMYQISPTISKDNTPGECVRNAKLLADFAKKHQRLAFSSQQVPEIFEDPRNSLEIAENARNVGVAPAKNNRNPFNPKRTRYVPGGPGGRGRDVEEDGAESLVMGERSNPYLRYNRNRSFSPLPRNSKINDLLKSFDFGTKFESGTRKFNEIVTTNDKGLISNEQFERIMAAVESK